MSATRTAYRFSFRAPTMQAPAVRYLADASLAERMRHTLARIGLQVSPAVTTVRVSPSKRLDDWRYDPMTVDAVLSDRDRARLAVPLRPHERTAND